MLVFSSYTFLSLVARMTWIIYFNSVLLPITTQLEWNAFSSWDGQSYPVYMFWKSAYLDPNWVTSQIYQVCQKGPSFFLSKNKWHILYFHQKLYRHHIHWFVPLASAIFFRQLHNSIIPKLFLFEQRTISDAFSSLLGNWNFFHWEFCKDQNKWIFEGTKVGEYNRWIRTFQTSYNSFCLVIKETKSLALSWWRIMCFLLTDSGHFSSSTAFSWPNWVGINHSSFQKEFITGDSFPIPPYTQYHLWMKTGLWWGWCWLISLVPQSHITV